MARIHEHHPPRKGFPEERSLLAALLANRGQRDAARDLLAPICAWFTEGADTPDLMEARALLEELNA